ncbi:hypothetical protein DCC85_16490 [Paenibacillus sp. CAA11]|uniref:hypothetical protein n=1 Tax=Paenibacillus sp. CAA11 TaxID=1532905 RepID=UPI000D3C158F|nr:hypothetical protein [Paenibacillus sp. CAA11]AWB45637.1 hypothetical protein DCC85_16490 [Paenibacillus sp. CAA11]
MAFGINRQELSMWKQQVSSGKIAFLTHYWLDPRFPGVRTVTKVGCSDLERLSAWCRKYELDPKYIHRRRPYPHFDLLGPKQREILSQEGLSEHIRRFKL